MISWQTFRHYKAGHHNHDHVEHGDHPENTSPPDDRREKTTEQWGDRRCEPLDPHQCGESRGCSPAMRDVGNNGTSDDDGGPARDALEQPEGDQQTDGRGERTPDGEEEEQ